MSENILNARLQHAVIGEGSTTVSSIPKKGEIIFNSTLDNCRVGNGSSTYNSLPDFIPTITPVVPTVFYQSGGQNILLESTIKRILYDAGGNEAFDINTYNHIVIDVTSLQSNPSYTISGVLYYPITTELPGTENRSVYKYLRNHPYKTLRISVFSSSTTDYDIAIGFLYANNYNDIWALQGLRWCTTAPHYDNYTIDVVNYTSSGNTTYYSIACKMVSTISHASYQGFGATFCITCVDPINSIFLIE